MLFNTLFSHRLILTVSILIQPSVIASIRKTVVTPTDIIHTTASCNQITLRSCPEDIQKLVDPGSNETIVSWYPPTLHATICTVEETVQIGDRSRQEYEYEYEYYEEYPYSGNEGVYETLRQAVFPLGTTVLSYLFHNIDGDEKVYCNFTVNVIGSCPEDKTNDPYPLTWSETEVDQVVQSGEKCPPYLGTVGPRGTRQCIEDPESGAVWQNVTVNDCIGDEDINAVLTELSQIEVTEDNVGQVSYDLAQITNRSNEISATELEAVSVVLESIVDVQSPSPEVRE
ncbi:uncharacterized protein [Amphiura filiformis]|uniref:uncharacterized protein n=1 Tax=Amphiura filiformis TaxID=82378 RepID=UPI003B228BCC